MTHISSIGTSELVAHMPEPIAQFSLGFGRVLGVGPDQAIFATCMFLAAPLGFILKSLPTARVKHAFSALVGVLFLYLVIGYNIVFLFAHAISVYLLLKFLPFRQIPVFVTVFSLGFLTSAHIYRVIYDYMGWTIDFALFLMLATVKVCTLACSYHDGLAITANLPICKAATDREDMRVYWETRAVMSLPSLLEYFSYYFNFATSLAGPVFQFRRYQEYMDLTLFKRNGLKNVPSTLYPALVAFIQVVLVFIPYFAGRMIIPLNGYANTDAFVEDYPNIWIRIIYVFFGVKFWRFTYYFAWYLADLACVTSGMAYSENGKWDGVKNASWVKVELGSSHPMMINNWNSQVNEWLKFFVFMRLADLPKFARNLITKMISAFWHGFYPGYYVFFFMAAIVTLIDSAVQRILAPFHSKLSSLGTILRTIGWKNPTFESWVDLIRFIITSLIFDFSGLAFVMLSLSNTLATWNNVGYFGFYIFAFGFILILLAPKPSKKKKE